MKKKKNSIFTSQIKKLSVKEVVDVHYANKLLLFNHDVSVYWLSKLYTKVLFS